MRGDVRAQIAVTQNGATRVAELCLRFSASTVTDSFAAVLKGEGVSTVVTDQESQ